MFQLKLKPVFSILFLSILITGCKGEEKPDVNDHDIPKRDVRIITPSNKAQYTVGEEVVVEIEVNHPDLISDLDLYLADTLVAQDLSLEDQTITINTTHGAVGNMSLYLLYKDGEGKEHRDNRTITFFSDIVPKAKSATIVNTYPHNPKSYTQGLEFYRGKMYEGTGQRGSSILAEVDWLSGNHIRKIDLDPSIFGEGITILNDTIYQITYQANKCLVYDMDLNLLTEFAYDGEGWGLCNDGNSLIMSNGSDRIVWRDPQTFQVTKEIQVFDDQTSVVQLNELELIDGNLFANVYTESYIVEVDTATGKVLSYVDCSAMVRQQGPGVDWFNGIATNNGKIYVTGKLWPNLYEVKFE